MSKLPKATLNTLIEFVPNNERERNIFDKLNKSVLSTYHDDTKKTYLNGMFYLGGQIKMSPNQEITLDKIFEVREIDRKREIEYGEPCNGCEAASIYHHKTMLCQMEEIIRAYNLINNLRNEEIVYNLLPPTPPADINLETVETTNNDFETTNNDFETTNNEDNCTSTTSTNYI